MEYSKFYIHIYVYITPTLYDNVTLLSLILSGESLWRCIATIRSNCVGKGGDWVGRVGMGGEGWCHVIEMSCNLN